MVTLIRGNKKRASERKCTYREYPVQDNADVAHKDENMHRNTNKFPELTFFGPHSKPHGARELSKHDHLRFDPKLVNGVCAIFRIPCDWVAYTSMLDKTCISGIPFKKTITISTCSQLHLLASPGVIQ